MKVSPRFMVDNTNFPCVPGKGRLGSRGAWPAVFLHALCSLFFLHFTGTTPPPTFHFFFSYSGLRVMLKLEIYSSLRRNHIRRLNIECFSGFFLAGKNIMKIFQTLSIFYSCFKVNVVIFSNFFSHK